MQSCNLGYKGGGVNDRPDAWICGLVSKPWGFMHLPASAIHDQKPLRFAYEIEWNSEKIQKSGSRTLGNHSVFAPEFPVAIFALKTKGNPTFLEGPWRPPTGTSTRSEAKILRNTRTSTRSEAEILGGPGQALGLRQGSGGQVPG